MRSWDDWHVLVQQNSSVCLVRQVHCIMYDIVASKIYKQFDFPTAIIDLKIHAFSKRTSFDCFSDMIVLKSYIFLFFKDNNN